MPRSEALAANDPFLTSHDVEAQQQVQAEAGEYQLRDRQAGAQERVVLQHASPPGVSPGG